MSQGLDHEKTNFPIPEEKKQAQGISEISPDEFTLKYSKLGYERYISANKKCVSKITSDEQFYTGGVYNCVSVSIMKKNGQSQIMHAPPYLVSHFIDKFIDQMMDDDLQLQSVLISGGAEEGQRVASKLFSEFSEIAEDVKWVTPPDEHSSISVAINPKSQTIEYAVNSYPPSMRARTYSLENLKTLGE